MNIKRMVKVLIPDWLLAIRARRALRNAEKGNVGVPLREVFNRVYLNKQWGSEFDYNSGGGSHDPKVVNAYVCAIKDFLRTFKDKPNVVDLGCGDFAVGSQIRPACNGYIACDIVPSLIERNRRVYKDLAVEFRCLNMVDEKLPDGDVVFIRQVLQHLSNDQILKILPKLQKYRYLVLTEHLPKARKFVSNIEKPAGPHIRVGANSGIVLTDPPFRLASRSARELLTVNDSDDFGLIRTIVYQLN